MASLYCQSEANSRRIAPSCPNGVVSGDDALAVDVHFEEDYCRVEDKNIQQNMNMLRKVAINLIKKYKERSVSKRTMLKIMFDCLLDPFCICNVLEN